MLGRRLSSRVSLGIVDLMLYLDKNNAITVRPAFHPHDKIRIELAMARNWKMNRPLFPYWISVPPANDTAHIAIEKLGERALPCIQILWIDTIKIESRSGETAFTVYCFW